jgi:hypothetical protein
MLSRKLFNVAAGLDVSGGDNGFNPPSAASPASAALSAQSNKIAARKALQSLNLKIEQSPVSDIITSIVSIRPRNGLFNPSGMCRLMNVP